MPALLDAILIDIDFFSLSKNSILLVLFVGTIGQVFYNEHNGHYRMPVELDLARNRRNGKDYLSEDRRRKLLYKPLSN